MRALALLALALAVSTPALARHELEFARRLIDRGWYDLVDAELKRALVNNPRRAPAVWALRLRFAELDERSTSADSRLATLQALLAAVAKLPGQRVRRLRLRRECIALASSLRSREKTRIELVRLIWTCGRTAGAQLLAEQLRYDLVSLDPLWRGCPKETGRLRAVVRGQLKRLDEQLWDGDLPRPLRLGYLTLRGQIHADLIDPRFPRAPDFSGSDDSFAGALALARRRATERARREAYFAWIECCLRYRRADKALALIGALRREHGCAVGLPADRASFAQGQALMLKREIGKALEIFYRLLVCSPRFRPRARAQLVRWSGGYVSSLAEAEIAQHDGDPLRAIRFYQLAILEHEGRGWALWRLSVRERSRAWRGMVRAFVDAGLPRAAVVGALSAQDELRRDGDEAGAQALLAFAIETAWRHLPPAERRALLPW